MGILLTDRVVATEFVPFCCEEPRDQPCRDAHGSEEDHHRSGVVFAISCFAEKEEILDGMFDSARVDIETVSITLGEMFLNRKNLRVRACGLPPNGLSQFRHPF